MKELISNWFEEACERWGDGLGYLISDDLISFYTFFTMIFSECFYLWSHHETTVAIPFMVILLGYIINVIVAAILKSWYEGERQEVRCAILYVVVFGVLFVIGCFIDIWLSVTITVIPFAVTFIWITIRTFQDTCFLSHPLKIVILISKLFRNKVFWVFSQIVVLGGPFIAFVVGLAQNPTLSITFKIAIPIVYAICVPFIAYFEDDCATCNIFELAYDISWSKEREELEKKLFREDVD